VNYFLAIDIGASSGRHILGHYENGKLVIEEIYRFRTILTKDSSGYLCWDINALKNDCIAGLKKAYELKKIPSRIGIDTFGVDYALLDEDDKLIGSVISYRDERTIEAKKKFLNPSSLFFYTGIQPQNFDTVYQLYCDKESGKLAKAKSLMLLPSYLAYFLTGVKQNERSILSTTALLDSRTGDFSVPVLRELGINKELFGKVVEPGSYIGPLRFEVAEAIGYTCDVFASLEHDTAAAFLGSEAKKGEALLSSGTWSLLGAMSDKPIISEASYEAGFTNEGSHKGEVRFLKNIMGMWIINRLKAESTSPIGVLEIVDKARKGVNYSITFDATDASLFSPDNMKDAVLALLKKGGHQAPKNDEELYYSVYHSLALTYASSIKELESLTGEKYKGLCIFGGGSKNLFLNELTEKATGLKVHVGPSEATALGNLYAITNDISLKGYRN
jgi:rhamnulokinase